MTVDVDRIAALVEWSHQPRPTVLAPDMRMGRLWFTEVDPMLIKGLKKIPNIVSAHNAHQSLRGMHGGTLVVVKAAYRETYHGLNDRVNQVIEEVVPLTQMTVWTEWLP